MPRQDQKTKTLGTILLLVSATTYNTQGSCNIIQILDEVEYNKCLVIWPRRAAPRSDNDIYCTIRDTEANLVFIALVAPLPLITG